MECGPQRAGLPFGTPANPGWSADQVQHCHQSERSNICFDKFLAVFFILLNRIFIMANITAPLLAELRRNGRATVSELAATLKVSRATVKAHLDRMTSDGTIVGFTVITETEPKAAAITGLITIALEGGAINRIVAQLRKTPEILTIRSTNGVWDIVVEFGVGDVTALDDILTEIRNISGVVRTETSIYLRHRHG